MEGLISDIQSRIKAEKLLFANTDEYTKEEIKFMTHVCLKTLQNEDCYMSIFYSQIPKLLKLYRSYNGAGFDRELYKLGIEVGKFISKTDEERRLEREGAEILYNQFIGLPKNENYADFIKNRIMDPEEVKEVLNNGSAYELYSYSTNFLLTNNFLFIHYPELYSIEDLAQLKSIATDVDDVKFDTKEEYDNFRRAAFETIARIRRYEKHNMVKVKTKSKNN